MNELCLFSAFAYNRTISIDGAHVTKPYVIFKQLSAPVLPYFLSFYRSTADLQSRKTYGDEKY